jgi:hypothetical protein
MIKADRYAPNPRSDLSGFTLEEAAALYQRRQV